jgi:hypothetical protein
MLEKASAESSEVYDLSPTRRGKIITTRDAARKNMKAAPFEAAHMT